MGLKLGAIGNTLEEHIGNLKEHVGNKGKMKEISPHPCPKIKKIKAL